MGLLVLAAEIVGGLSVSKKMRKQVKTKGDDEEEENVTNMIAQEAA